MTPARVLFDEPALQAGVGRLAGEVSAAYPAGLLVVAVLKGSVIFLADLTRRLTSPVEVDFLAVSSYAPGTGRVRIVKDLERDIGGRHVLVVEDVVDTGLTLTYLLGQLTQRGPASLAVCTLLDKTARRIVPVDLRFVGYGVGDEFVVGYGLDYAGRYRNLPVVAAADLGALREDPDAHVEQLYGR